MHAPIPAHLYQKFSAHLAAVDDDDVSDGAWLQILTDAAYEFMRINALHGDAHDAVMQYVRTCAKQN